MGGIVLLLVCIVAGMLLRLLGRLPGNAPTVLNAVVVNVALPALALQSIHSLRWSASLLAAVSMPWLLFAIGLAFFWGLSRTFALSRGTTGALMLVGGIGNTSMVGIPMIVAFFGPRYIPVGIAIGQLGSYLVLSTLGILVASLYSATLPSASGVLRRIATFPPLIALVAAVVSAPLAYPEWLTSVLNSLGGMVVPLALVSIGLQLHPSAIVGHRVALAAGLGFKLIVGPAVIAAIYVCLLRHLGDTDRVTLFESAMAPMIGGSVIAMQYRLNDELTSMMVALGTLASFVTVPAWWGGAGLAVTAPPPRSADAAAAGAARAGSARSA
jgi:predicted permease